MYSCYCDVLYKCECYRRDNVIVYTDLQQCVCVCVCAWVCVCVCVCASVPRLPDGRVRKNSAGKLPGFDNVTVSDTEHSTDEVHDKQITQNREIERSQRKENEEVMNGENKFVKFVS